MNEIQPSPRFINTTSDGVDLYPSKSQEKTAINIANHILAAGDEHSLIGIDGQWGSGKSNMLGIVQTLLGSEYHFFVYDTWSHQEDLQRRSFLEELTESLKEHVENEKKWKENLKKLLAKTKESTKKTIPRLSNAIIVSFIVLIATPLLNILAGIFDDAYLKIGITALPLLGALIVWLIIKLRKGGKEKKLQDFFYLFQQKQLEETTEETISENEPSIRKFRNWLRELSQDLKQNKKIVIVFDNIDRLPASKVQVIWSLIHTFFSSESFPKVTVIVPFDRQHIREAFNVNDDDTSDYEKTNHFINKTFPVIFNVAPPILTDWKWFFERKFEEAFGETESSEFIMVRKIFDFYTPILTPRKVISFVNDLVASKLIADPDIGLRYIALFVLNRQKIVEKPVHQILNKEFLTPSQHLFAGDSTVSNNIASLLYNIPLAKAAQISLQRDIEFAIREKRINDLLTYADNDDFISILEQISTDSIEVEASAICLNELDRKLQDKRKDALQVMWDRIVGKQLMSQQFEVKFTDIHRILIMRVRPQQRIDLIKYLMGVFYNGRDYSAKNYFYAVNDLKSFLNEKVIQIDLTLFIRHKNVSAEQFTEFISLAKEGYQYYGISCEAKELEDHYHASLDRDLTTIATLSYVQDEFKFASLRKAIEEKIEGGLITIEAILPVFTAYKALMDGKPVTRMLSDGKISQLLSETEEATDVYYELVAMRIARGSKFANTKARDTSVMSLVDEKTVEEVAKRLQSYNTFGACFLDALDWPEPLLKECIKKIISNDSAKAGILSKILPRFNTALIVLDISNVILLKCLNRWHGELKAKLSRDSLPLYVPEVSIYKHALEVDNEITHEIFTSAKQFVEGANQEQWSDAFKDTDSYLLNLLLLLLDSKKLVNVPSETFSAFRIALKSIALDPDEYNLNKLWEKFLSIYEKTDKYHLKATIKDIRDLFLRENEISAELFLFFEIYFREIGDMMERAGDVVRKILTPVSSESSCFIKMLENARYYIEIIGEADEDAFDFIDAVRDKIESGFSEEGLKELNGGINEHLANNITIIFGKYYSPKTDKSAEVEVTQKLKQIVEKEKNCHFKINNDIVDGDDPIGGVVKNLYVKYTYKGIEKEKNFEEHKWLRLP